MLGPVLLCAWGYFAPDYGAFFSTPLGRMPLGELAWNVGYLALLIPLLYATVSWLYEAWTGRDAVWFWHPD